MAPNVRILILNYSYYTVQKIRVGKILIFISIENNRNCSWNAQNKFQYNKMLLELSTEISVHNYNWSNWLGSRSSNGCRTVSRDKLHSWNSNFKGMLESLIEFPQLLFFTAHLRIRYKIMVFCSALHIVCRMPRHTENCALFNLLPSS